MRKIDDKQGSENTSWGGKLLGWRLPTQVRPEVRPEGIEPPTYRVETGCSIR
jgi:hypothetical protein